jgi:SAM-dependent methyltransferase
VLCDSSNEGLDALVSRDINPAPFRGVISRLHGRFAVFSATCPAPLPTPGLIVTPEIRYQSELYLPIVEIESAFNLLYRTVLSYNPIVSSTPFHKALSWADVFVSLPPRFHFSANPARLLEAMLVDRDLLTKFLFASFLPHRFYGGFGRYPGQQEFIREWLELRDAKTIRCLDAACGTGEDSYALARLLKERGYRTEDVQIEGWTLEPLEVWAAVHRRFPHDPVREEIYRRLTCWIVTQKQQKCISFRSADLSHPPGEKTFDLILCNGLLGGPIIHKPAVMDVIVRNLVRLLAPGGMLLVADQFHDGWKMRFPKQDLMGLFDECGLTANRAGEGIYGIKTS